MIDLGEDTVDEKTDWSTDPGMFTDEFGGGG